MLSWIWKKKVAEWSLGEHQKFPNLLNNVVEQNSARMPTLVLNCDLTWATESGLGLDVLQGNSSPPLNGCEVWQATPWGGVASGLEPSHGSCAEAQSSEELIQNSLIGWMRGYQKDSD